MPSSLSADNLTIEDVLNNYSDLAAALHRYFDPAGPDYATIFATEQASAVQARYQDRVREIELSYSLTALASLEAAFMVDYMIRCKLKKKDSVSRALRIIYKRKRDRAALIDDLLKTWNRNAYIPPRLFNDLIRAFELRNWLAHGRWWVLKIGRPTYDFLSVYQLVSRTVAAFPLEGA